MAAKRKSNTSPKPAGNARIARGTDIEASPVSPVELPAPAHLETGGEHGGKPTERSSKPSEQSSKPSELSGKPPAPKGGPVPRGGARFGGIGRGHGAPQPRRHAFRRS